MGLDAGGFGDQDGVAVVGWDQAIVSTAMAVPSRPPATES